MENRAKEKPWGDGEDYNKYILSEFNSFRKDAWKKQILKHFGVRKSLKVLDLGTGPGFFATIISEEGHLVTAIDYSENMLSCAKKNAENFNVCPEFFRMDINDLTFVDNTFDVIVTRNVTWTLEYPEQVYENLYRILKKGGILLIYDANWHLHFFDNDKLKSVREREKLHFLKFGINEIVAVENREFFNKAPLTSIQRPQWDRQILSKLGFEVDINEDIGEILYEEWEKNLYGESPLFEICALKL